MNCNHACLYNTFDGCKVKEYHGICPLSNTVPVIERKPMTNADRIRAMSDEELAAFLDGVQEEECKTLHEVREDGTFKFESLRGGWLAWLQQPAEEVHDE